MSEIHVLNAIRDFAEGNEPTLKAFAMTLDIPATRLYAASKKPIPGQVYDPSVRNWDALNEMFLRYIDEGKNGITSLEALVKGAVEKDAYLAEHRAVRTASGDNTIEVDGGKMPKRKAAMFEMGSEQESLVCFKHDANVYRMVYQTAGYTCIRAVNEDGSFAREEVRTISNGTFNTKCVAPSNMAQGIADRFSGAYAEAEAEAVAEAPVDNAEAVATDVE